MTTARSNAGQCYAIVWSGAGGPRATAARIWMERKVLMLGCERPSAGAMSAKEWIALLSALPSCAYVAHCSQLKECDVCLSCCDCFSSAWRSTCAAPPCWANSSAKASSSGKKMRDSCMMSATLTKIEGAGNTVWRARARPRRFTYVSNKSSTPSIFSVRSARSRMCDNAQNAYPYFKDSCRQ